MKKFICFIICLIFLIGILSTISYAMATDVNKIQSDTDVYIIGVTNQDTPIIGTLPQYDAGEGTMVIINPYGRIPTYGQVNNPITGNTYNAYNNSIIPTYTESTILNNTTNNNTSQTSEQQEEEKKEEAKLPLEEQAIEFKIETTPKESESEETTQTIEQPKPGFFKRIINFFKKLFGKNEPEEVINPISTEENTSIEENTSEIITEDSINEENIELKLDTPYKKLIQEIFNLTNLARTEQNLTPLTYNIELQTAADIRAQEISQVFSHIRPNNTTCFTVASEIEYNVIGENIIMADNPLNSPSILMDTWMNSEGHKANILFPDYSSIAIGIYVKDNVTYAVQLFIG